jgi:two-component system sensor histidine kinase DctS
VTPAAAPARTPTQKLRRWLPWGLLVALVAALLGTLLWLARSYETEQVQRALERDNADAVADLRHALTADAQALRRMTAAATPPQWEAAAQELLIAHPAWLRLEWRNAGLHPRAAGDSPFASQPLPLPADPAALQDACFEARQSGAASFAPSRFMLREGLGVEVMPMCVLVAPSNAPQTYAIAYYALDGVLDYMLDENYKRRQSVSLTEPDGTRLASHGAPRRGARIFTSRQTLDLPGNPLVLRMDGWRGAPNLFPDVLSVTVTLLAAALAVVLVMLGRDFRRRQQAEDELADALAFRKAMEDSLVTGLRALDLQGRITYVNPAFCAMVGYAPEELIGRSGPAPYWPAELTDAYTRRRAARQATGGSTLQGIESEYQRKDGTRLPVLLIEAPLITATGKHSGWMSAVLDLSEQRRVQERQRAAQERLQAAARLAAVGEMASLLSHELNQPLAAISSYANGSLNLLPGAWQTGDAAQLADVRLALGRIAEQAGRAGRVIHSVHKLVRRGADARTAAKPLALAEAVLPLVQLQARKLGAGVDVRIPPELPSVSCEPVMVEQVLLNLARNGLQAMAAAPGERVLTLSAECASPDAGAAARPWVAFSVTDTGEGISPDVAEQLFTPFFTTKAEGMGMGLSLCRTVVEQHGGTLGYTPNTPRGTIFRFTLPVALEHENQEELQV